MKFTTLMILKVKFRDIKYSHMATQHYLSPASFHIPKPELGTQ